MTKVLFVDDNEFLCTVIYEGLELLDFETVCTHSGNSAKELIPGGGYDIVVTDLHMNDGGGQQLIEWCTQNHPNLKILAISGEELDSFFSALDVVDGNGTPTLAKPLEIKQLAEVISGIIGNKFY